MSAADPLRTRCPFCHALYRVSRKQLRAADGQVRCSSCNSVFDGKAFLEGEVDNSVPAVPPPPRESLQEVVEPKAERQGRLLLRALWLVVTILVVVLLLQIVHFQSNRIATSSPTLRPLIESYCNLTGCKVAPRRDIGAIELRSRDIRSHASVANALVISAVMVNRAAYAQPFPLFEISLTNLQGRIVATRHFEPHEYLDNPALAEARMAPGLPVRVTMEIFDPGEHAVGFEFAFH